MLLSLLALSQQAHAFCGTYVGGAGSEFFNEYAQVAVVRSGEKTPSPSSMTSKEHSTHSHLSYLFHKSF